MVLTSMPHVLQVVYTWIRDLPFTGKLGITTHLINSNSNSTFIVLNLCQKTDSEAHHTKTLFNIQKPEILQGLHCRESRRLEI